MRGYQRIFISVASYDLLPFFLMHYFVGESLGI